MPALLIRISSLSKPCIQEQASVLITTNKGFEQWTEFLDDPALATAVLDCLTFHCDTIQMSGKSYCLENRKSFLD